MKKAKTIIVYQGLNEQFRVRLVGSSGEVILNSELIADQKEAVQLAKALEKVYGGKVEVRPTIDEADKPQEELKAPMAVAQGVAIGGDK